MTPEAAAMIAKVLLGGVTGEQKTTAKVIASIPEQNHDYKPDAKSKTAMELAAHVVQADVFFLDGIAAGAFDPKSAQKAPEAKTGAELATWYNGAFEASAAKVAALDGAALAKIVDFYGMVQMPAVMFLSFLNNHSIHHRGQLSTYLRAMGGKCPSIYGPSADDDGKGGK